MMTVRSILPAINKGSVVLKAVYEKTCGGWCVSANGWYIKRGDGSNMAFNEKFIAEDFIEWLKTKKELNF